MKVVQKFIFFISLALAGCQCSEDDEQVPGEESPSGVVITSNGTSPTTTPVFSTIPAGGADMLFLTPEQYSNQIYAAFQYRYGWTNNDGGFTDAITEFYQVPLGGVDFNGADVRDRNPQVQTLLTIRAINWDVATGVVWREANPAEPVDPILFIYANPGSDRPFFESSDSSQSQSVQNALRESESRWQQQVDHVYWKMFNRPITSSELDLAKQHFHDSHLADESMVQAWMGFVYALMSTAEWMNP